MVVQRLTHLLPLLSLVVVVVPLVITSPSSFTTAPNELLLLFIDCCCGCCDELFSEEEEEEDLSVNATAAAMVFFCFVSLFCFFCVSSYYYSYVLVVVVVESCCLFESLSQFNKDHHNLWFWLLIFRSACEPEATRHKACVKKVVVHSYVEVCMYLLHKTSTKPKLRESCFFMKARFLLYYPKKH